MTVANRDVREIVRVEPSMRPRILRLLADGPLTVPEIAAALDCPAHEVVFWVMSMRRYGYLHEVAGVNGDGYFRYQAVERKDPTA